MMDGAPRPWGGLPGAVVGLPAESRWRPTFTQHTLPLAFLDTRGCRETPTGRDPPRVSGGASAVGSPDGSMLRQSSPCCDRLPSRFTGSP